MGVETLRIACGVAFAAALLVFLYTLYREDMGAIADDMLWIKWHERVDETNEPRGD